MANEFKVKKGLIVDGSNTVLDIQGTSGQLFSVTDSLTGDLFSVSDVSGVPILNVNSSGIVTVDGSFQLEDNNKIQLGNSQDLELYHNETHSYIDSANTGDLYIRSLNDDVVIQGADDVFIYTQGGEDAIIARGDGAVELYYDNSKKLETTNAGIKITGIPTIETATVSGTALYIHNTTDSVENTTTLIDFRAHASDNSSFYVSGQMGSKAEGTWTSTSSTRDASLIFNTVLNGNNELALTLASDKSATFAGTISSKEISIKQQDDSGFDAGLTIERSANTQKVHIGMDGGAVNFNSPDGLSYKFRNNGTEKFTVDGSGNATFAGNVSSTTANFADNVYMLGGQLYLSASDATTNDSFRLYAASGQFVIASRESGTWTTRFDISDSGNATFAGTISSSTLTVGNSGTSRFTDTGAFPLQLNRGLPVDVYGTNGVVLGLGSYSTGTTYVDAARIAANLESATSGDFFIQVNNGGSYTNALTINNDTHATFAGNLYLPEYIYHDGETTNYIKFSTDEIILDSGNSTLKLTSAGKTEIHGPDLGGTSGNTAFHTTIRGARHHLDFVEHRTANGTDWSNTTYKLNMRVDSTNHQSIDFVSDSGFLEHIDIRTGNQVFNTRFTHDGKVGIGTSSPENLLHIKAADGVTGVLKIEGGKSTSTSVGEINSQIDFGSNDGSVWSTGNVGGRIASVTETTNGALTGMAFYTFRQGVSSPDSLSEKVRITNDGKVGIGVTSPDAKLQVGANQNSNATGISLCAGASVGNLIARTTTHHNWFPYTDGNNYYSAGTHNFRDGGNGSNYLTLTSSLATFAGNAIVVDPASGDAELRLQSSTQTLRLDQNSIRTTTNSDLNLFTNGNTNQLFLDQGTGNVGIATSSPEAKLEVDGTSLSDGDTVFDIQGDDGQLFSVTNSLTGDLFSVSDISGVPILNVNSSGAVEVDGNLGINATPTTNAIEIDGADGTSYVHFKSDAATTGARVGLNSDDLIIENKQATGDMIFDTAATERFRIASGGDATFAGDVTISGGHLGLSGFPRTDLHATWNQMFIGSKGSLISENGSGGIAGMTVSDNLYIDSDTGTYAYLTTNEASQLTQEAGILTFKNAASGTAGNAPTLTERFKVDASGNATFGGDVDLYTTGATDTNQINLPRAGFITFYGDTSKSHSIGSRSSVGSAVDDLRINTYGALYINLDSNNNNTSGADFMIGRHGGQVGTISDVFFTIDGETGNTTITGDVIVGSGGTGSWGELELGTSTDAGWNATDQYPYLGSNGGSAGSLVMLHNPHVPFRTDNARSGASGRAGIRMHDSGTSWWDIGVIGLTFEIWNNATATSIMQIDASNNTTFAGQLTSGSYLRSLDTYQITLDSVSAGGPKIEFGATNDWDLYGHIGHQSGQYQFGTHNRDFAWLNGTTEIAKLTTSGELQLVSNLTTDNTVIYENDTGTKWQWGSKALTATNKFGGRYHSGSGWSSLLWSINASGNVAIAGALSKGSGSFKIDHPLESKKDTHDLVHSFIEGPQADLIYRGKVDLVDGQAEVNIDTEAGMTEGTFVLLNTNVQCFTTNESNWDLVKGSVSANILTIESQNTSSNATISWMVVGERQDQHMIDTDWTDDNGKIIVEPRKVE